MNRIQPNGYRMAWAPAALRPAVGAAPSLGEATPFLESPLVATLTDAIVGISATYFAWGLAKQGNKMSTPLYVVAAVSGVKFLHDMSRID